MILNIKNVNQLNFTDFAELSNLSFKSLQSNVKTKSLLNNNCKHNYQASIMIEDRKPFTYEEARKYVQTHFPDVNTSDDFFRIVKRANSSKRLPKHPQRYYQKTGEWHAAGWRHFLAKEHHTLAQFNVQLEYDEHYKLTYDCASGIMKAAKVRCENEYAAFRVAHRAESILPKNPRYYYSKSQRFDIRDFFAPKYISIDKFKQELKRIPTIETYTDWRRYSQTLRPAYVPSNPFDMYGMSIKQLKQYQTA